MGRACRQFRRRQVPPSGLRGRPSGAPVRWRGKAAQDAGSPVQRHRPGVRCEGQAHCRLALQRRQPLVRRRQDRQSAPTGMEGQPHRDRHQPGRRVRGDRHAGERAARLAPDRRAAHADERLSGQDAGDEFHPQRQVAGHLRRRRHRAVAVLWRRADEQGADRTRRRRWRHLHAGRREPAAGCGGGRLLGRAGGAGRHRRRPHPAGLRPGRGPVSALTWSADGAHLAFGTETGFAALVNFSRPD